MANLKIPEEHFHILLNNLAKRLFDNDAFKYISKINCVDSGPTDYTYEIGYNSEDAEFINKVPSRVFLKEVDDSYDDSLFVCTRTLAIEKNTVKANDSSCSEIDNKTSQGVILGGGGIKVDPCTPGITTLGVIFRDDVSKKLLGLTCSHGLRDTSTIFYSQRATNYKQIGRVKYKNLVHDMDYAIVEVDQNELSNVEEGVLLYTNQDQIKQNIFHHVNDTPVRKYGIITNGTSGIIDSNDTSYKYKDELLKGNYMVRSDAPCNFFSDEGDSGSLVVDDSLNPVGILVRIQGYKSVVLPLINIVNHIDTQTSQNIKLIFNH